MIDFIVKMVDKEIANNPSLSFLDALDIVRTKLDSENGSSESSSKTG